MDRKQLETDIETLTQNFRQASEQTIRLAGAIQYAQQLLARLDEKEKADNEQAEALKL